MCLLISWAVCTYCGIKAFYCLGHSGQIFHTLVVLRATVRQASIPRHEPHPELNLLFATVDLPGLRGHAFRALVGRDGVVDTRDTCVERVPSSEQSVADDIGWVTARFERGSSSLPWPNTVYRRKDARNVVS